MAHWIYIISLNSLGLYIALKIFAGVLVDSHAYILLLVTMMAQFLAAMYMSLYFIRAVKVRYPVLNDLLR